MATRNKTSDRNSTPSALLLLANLLPKTRAAILAQGASISALAQVLPQTAAVLLSQVLK